MSDWGSQFKALFGDAVTTDGAAHAVQGVTPACVCAPENESQAAAMIRFAADHRVPVVPCGGGTEQGRCAPPPSGFLALSTKRMNRLIHHEPGDMVATVQGGMWIDAFRIQTGQRGQWLPLDATASTIGGLVGANAYGPRAWGYGTLRDMILGMNVINGDGVLRKCGGKVVKNVTGYSLEKLYIGSMGTLGLITEVTFKLRPLPVDGRQWGAEFDAVERGVGALRSIAEKNLPLEMLRLYRAESDSAPGLWICASGTSAELQRLDSELRSAIPSLMLSAIAYEEFGGNCSRGQWAYSQNNVWGLQENQFVRSAAERKTPGALLRFGCTASKLDAALSCIHLTNSMPFSIGLNGGIIDFSTLTESEAARIASELEKLGVNFAWENTVGVNIPNRWGSPRPEWALMKQIKSALDPQGIMNPGRFVV